jgi:hypothetical protein
MFLRHRLLGRSLAVILSAGLALPALAAPSHKAKSPAPPRGSRLDGRILAADGKTPIRGATLEVRPLDGGTSWTSLPTDHRGRFEMRGLHYGWNEVVVRTEKGEFLADQAINLPPGGKVIVSFSLLETADKPASWWTERHVEPPTDLAGNLSGMAETSQRLTGVDYWKSPAGIAILAGAGAAALALIAIGGRGSTNSTTTTTTPAVSTPIVP